MSRGDAARVVIRGVFVPLGLGLLGFSLDGYRIRIAESAPLEFVAAYV